jgi:hypothetical protein
MTRDYNPSVEYPRTPARELAGFQNKAGVPDPITMMSMLSRIAIYLTCCLSICPGQPRLLPRRAQERATSTKVIFDQNNPKFYGGSTQLMVQFPSRGNSIPYGRFAVFVGLGDEQGKVVAALEPRPLTFDRLRTGYYVLPPSRGGLRNVFGLVINADDPRNRHGDISYVMPGVWLSSVTWPREKILKPWVGFDSLEYSVDLRVPFANSTNIYYPRVVEDDWQSDRRPDFAAPYVLGGIYFEQLRKLGGSQRPPAFWLAVTLFDLRKHHLRETLIVDDWSGGTNYPIITSTVGRAVSPVNGALFHYAPPASPLEMITPTYSFTLPNSESMLTETSAHGPFHHFAFRVTREHFLAAVDAIRSQLSAYGANGRAPMSTDPSDWGLTYFDFDAEIFHHSTLADLQPAEKSRAMVVEFKNLRVLQANRSPKSLTAHGALENVEGPYLQGFACYDVDPIESHISPEQLANLRETPVSVELSAVDANRTRTVALGRVSARLTIKNSAASCGERRNGHSFKFPIPLERVVQIAESGVPMFITARAMLGSGNSMPLQDPSTGPLGVPTADLVSYTKGLTGRFEGVTGRTAVGWACLPGKEDAVPIDLLVKPKTDILAAGALAAHGYADLPAQPMIATWEACAQKGGHTFRIDLPPTFTLDDDQTLVAVARPGNYASPSPLRPSDLQLPQADPLTNPIRLEAPSVKGFFDTVKSLTAGTIQIRGWACMVGSEHKLRIRVAAMTAGGQAVSLKESVADRASEAGVQSACQMFNEAGDAEVRPDGQGFRFDVTLDAKDTASLGPAGLAGLLVEADPGIGRQSAVRIPRVPGPH